MKELLLIPSMLSIFVFGYYIMARLDRFIEESQRLIVTENRNAQSKVRIAAENSLLLDNVSSALERCSNAEPHLEFFLSKGRSNRILEKLLAEQVDIVLLADVSDEQLDGRCASLCLPCSKAPAPECILGLPVENLDADTHIRVIWRKDLRSKDRDRVIFALENEYSA